MTVKELHQKLTELLVEHGDEPVYADIVQEHDPVPPVEAVIPIDGYVLITN